PRRLARERRALTPSASEPPRAARRRAAEALRVAVGADGATLWRCDVANGVCRWLDVVTAGVAWAQGRSPVGVAACDPRNPSRRAVDRFVVAQLERGDAAEASAVAAMVYDGATFLARVVLWKAGPSGFR